MKVKIVVMHDKDNYNGSTFSFSSMKEAEESIKNTPILGYIITDENNSKDFDEHNMNTELIDNNGEFSLETKYLEKPIGLIPESCNPRYEVIDGYNYFIVDGYIWKCYSNGAYKLIPENGFKSVSMEIEVLNGEFDNANENYIINKYKYLGVTCLGDHQQPAMGDECIITKYTSMNRYKKDIEDIYIEIYKLENGKEEYSLEDTKKEITEDKKEVKDEVKKNEDSLSLEPLKKILGKIPKTKEDIEKIVEKFDDLNKKYSVLENFKKEIDDINHEKEIDEIISEFTLLEDDEIKEFKCRALDRELSKEGFKKELYALQGMKYVESMKSKKNFNLEDEKDISIQIKDNQRSKNKPYGGILG